MDRVMTTLDVTVSKIFPAGFGWQGASVIAGNTGFASHSLPFFICTGLGDFSGVLIGQTGFKVLEKAVGYDIDVKEAQTGLLLGSAAFCSGFSWQPILNSCTGSRWASLRAPSGRPPVFFLDSSLRLRHCQR